MPFMTMSASLVGIDIRAEIERLRREKNAVILAHYYQKPELQDLADFVGDSLELSRKAAETDADVIAFCGVKFMAEVAKILSPEKTVILPDMNAGCSPGRRLPPAVQGVSRGASRSHRAHLHQLLDRGEGAVRHHRDLVPAPRRSCSRSPRPEDHLRPRPPSGRLSLAQVQPRDAAVAGRVHRA
jgi:hypothetical protein